MDDVLLGASLMSGNGRDDFLLDFLARKDALIVLCIQSLHYIRDIRYKNISKGPIFGSQDLSVRDIWLFHSCTPFPTNKRLSL